MANEQKFFIPSEMCQVIRTPCDEIIHPDDFMAFGKQAITKMRAQETCCARYQYTHEFLPPVNSFYQTVASNLSGFSGDAIHKPEITLVEDGDGIIPTFYQRGRRPGNLLRLQSWFSLRREQDCLIGAISIHNHQSIRAGLALSRKYRLQISDLIGYR